MNRRILLIDADPGFHQTLADHLGPFGLDVINEPNPEQAVALATAQLPALLIVGVEEPDKLGFKVFQRCRKGALGKVPIMLITASVTPESFAKHQTLKSHANEYLDKRTATRDELLAKIDGMIVLGTPSAPSAPSGEVGLDSLDIPVDLDDIQVADDDLVVLDEEVDGEDFGGDFGDDPHAVVPGGERAPLHLPEDAPPRVELRTEAAPDAPAADHGSASHRVDSIVDAEVEDAFGGLLGDDFVEPSFGGIGAHRDEVASADEPAMLRDPEPPADGPAMDAVPASADATHDSVPVAVPDPMSPPEVTPAVSPSGNYEGVPGVIHDGGRPDEVDDNHDFDDVHAAATRGPGDGDQLIARLRSQSEDDDAGRDDAARSGIDAIGGFDTTDDDRARPVAQTPDDPPPAPSYASSPAIALDLSDLQVVDDDSGGVPEPVPHVNKPEREPSAPIVASMEASIEAPDEAATEVPVADDDIAVEASPAPAPPQISARARRPSVSINPSELGLDQIAQEVDPERDQSGAYDRRSLRKIGELERQLAQLKHELDRARQVATAASKTSGREGEFLKLRENLLVQGKELGRATDELAARDRTITDLDERLRHTQETRMTLEAKAADLEHRATTETQRATTLADRERALLAQLDAAQQELEARGKATEDATIRIARLEHDLANEHALRASSASDAEHALRVEREQMIARHQGELTAARDEMLAARDAALDALRTQLEADHATSVAVAVDGAAESARQAIATEAEQAIAQLEAQQAADLGRLADEHVAALAQAAADRDAAVQRAKDDQATAIERLQGEHAAQLSEVEEQHGEAVAELEAELGGKVSAATSARESAVGELRAELARAEAALAEATARHDQLITHHKTTAAEHEARTTSEIKDQAASYEAKLDASRQETTSQATHHAETLTRLVEEHKQTIARIEARRDELAKGGEQQQRALDEATTRGDALAAQVTALEARLEEAQAQATTTIATLEADAEAAAEAHARALAERTAQHETALADAQGQAGTALAQAINALEASHKKAVDALTAAHQKAIDAAQAELARGTTELVAERDELRKGLSSARDTIRRSETELAAAVQTIADRNAEVRAHGQALAERDTRIAELRNEIETVEHENTSYQEQVLRAYQKIKTDEAMVARAKKAMAIALTVLDDQGTSKTES